MDHHINEEQLKDTIMLAGEILSESGAEGLHIETTMNDIAHHFGFNDCQSFCTNLNLSFALHDQTYPRMKRINIRDTNMKQISQTTATARKLIADEITLTQAYERLMYIQIHDNSYPLWMKSAASGIVGFCFLYLQNGSFGDMLTVIIATTIGFLVTNYVADHVHAFFIPEFVGSLIIALIATLGHHYVPDGKLSILIISAVMPIVPGVLITNAIRDLLVGNMMMFLAKGLEAAVTAFAIGAGVATILNIF